MAIVSSTHSETGDCDRGDLQVDALAGVDSRVVLTYHEIVPSPNPYFYSTTRDCLESHLRLITELKMSAAAGCPVEVTFDDGHTSHYEYALPLLEQFRIRGTFFVTAGWTGNQPDYMTAAQLKELTALGHRVQAHGWSHKHLTLCSPAELREELQHTRYVLEDRLGVPVDAISIPHGRWNMRVLEACARAGYKDVYISDPSTRVKRRSGVNIIGRITATRTMDRRALQNLLSTGHTSFTPRVNHRIKTGVRSVLGDRLYHRIWRLLASDTERIDGAIPSGRPPSILHLISSEGFYGAESMLVNLARALNANDCQTIVGVFQNSHNPHTEVGQRGREAGLTVEIIPCDGQIDRNSVRHIRGIIDQYGVDVVHTHGSKANFYGALAAGSLRVPLVATYHMAWPDRDLRLYLYHLVDRLILRRFRRIVAVSDAVARSLSHAGLSRRKITTVANGIDVLPFMSHLQGGRSQNENRTVLGLVGRLTPHKGHCHLIEIAPALLADFPEVVFHFIGDGPERSNLEQMVRTRGLEDRILFLGYKTDMPAVYSSIDILLLPSISEGMPMTLIEALAAGRPVIASRVGDIPKLIRHGETGLLVGPGDRTALEMTIRQLLSDPAQRLRLGCAGQRWVCEQFSAENMARRYREVYSEVLTCTTAR